MLEAASGLAIGGIGFHRAPGDDGTVEIGYSIAASRQGRGLATMAVRAIIDIAAAGGALRLVAGTDPDNPASQRVLEKCGFARTEDDGAELRWELRLPDPEPDLSPAGDRSPRRRAVLVTGASRGIGAAIARAFAERGDRVALHYGAAEQAAAATLESLAGDGHVMVRADLRDPEAIRQMVDEAALALGGLDILVNNAGVFHDHPIESSDYAAWQQAWSDTLGVNLVGAANVTWCALQHMPRGGGSRIVNVGSRGAFRGEPTSPAYGASKAGIAAFGQSIAKALGPAGIAVTTLAPGFVDTDMAAELLGGPTGDEIRNQSPFGRVPSADEVARAVLFLASTRGRVGERLRAGLQRGQLLPPLTPLPSLENQRSRATDSAATTARPSADAAIVRPTDRDVAGDSARSSRAIRSTETARNAMPGTSASTSATLPAPAITIPRRTSRLTATTPSEVRSHACRVRLPTSS